MRTDIDAVVTDDPRLVFHSLRHHFKDRGREAGIQEYVLDQLCGHAPASVGGHYGDGASIPSLKMSLDRLEFGAVDRDAMKRAADAVHWTTVAKAIVDQQREPPRDQS